MKILMINKFLYPRGGAETYVFKLGEQLIKEGHEVQYFGMEHADNIVHNRINAYTKYMDFRNARLLERLRYPLRTIYSTEARKKIRLVLEDFQPEVCHLNNFNYQLTPSIILEIRKWERASGKKCRIVMTAHDPQLVCPNHMCQNPNTKEICEKCLHGSVFNCIRGKCIHGSALRSIIGAAEALFWRMLGTYREIDHIICCSHFMKRLLDTNPVLAGKTTALHNFVERAPMKKTQKQDYVLYFGRFSEEKGIRTLVSAAKNLPEVNFIFAGSGPLEGIWEGTPNIRFAGFQTGEALEKLIREARFSLITSECYENCPFSVLESQMCGTPVLGADIGGIPELIIEEKTGEFFKSGDIDDLTQKIGSLWNDKEKTDRYAANCQENTYDTVKEYTEKIIDFYKN
ncbi:MAG: glycosyltransferase family 4 protein [Clostridiales bacterium]|nr:glycosyltransferase family 4 protein [Clostridiales bacterium]